LVAGVWPVDEYGNEVEAEKVSETPTLVAHFSDPLDEDEVPPEPSGSSHGAMITHTSQETRRQSTRPRLIRLELDTVERPVLDGEAAAVASTQRGQVPPIASQHNLLLTQNMRRNLQMRTRYVVAAGSCIESLATPSPFFLTAMDHAHKYDSFTKELLVVGGLPRVLLLRSESVCGESSAAESTISPLYITAASKLTDLEVFIKDAMGHTCSNKKIKVDLKVTCRVHFKLVEDDEEEEEQEVQLFSKKAVKLDGDMSTKVTLNFAKLFNELRFAPKSGWKVDVSVTANYSLNGVKTDLEPAIIRCVYRKLNILTKMSSEVDLSPEAYEAIQRLKQVSNFSQFSENTVPCGRDFCIKLIIETEDGEDPDIHENDIGLTVATSAKVRGVDANAIKRTAVLSGNEMRFQPICFDVAGSYNFTFEYNENRLKFTEDKLLSHHLLQVLLFVSDGNLLTCTCGAGEDDSGRGAWSRREGDSHSGDCEQATRSMRDQLQLQLAR
jgi:hypothetical protein